MKYGFLKWNPTRRINASFAFRSSKVPDLASQTLIPLGPSQAEQGVGCGEGLGSLLSSCSLGRLVLGLSCPQHCDVRMSHTWLSRGNLNRISLISTHLHFPTRSKTTKTWYTLQSGANHGQGLCWWGKGRRKGKEKERLPEFSFSKALPRLAAEESGGFIQIHSVQKPGCFFVN